MPYVIARRRAALMAPYGAACGVNVSLVSWVVRPMTGGIRRGHSNTSTVRARGRGLQGGEVTVKILSVMQLLTENQHNYNH